MVSHKVLNLCQGKTTVSSELARDPTLAPGKVAKQLYGEEIGGHEVHKKFELSDASAEDQENFRVENGTIHDPVIFSSKSIYHDMLCTLEGDPMVGITSPPLMGSSGVVPLGIIAPLPDICRHISNCIVHVEEEVFLATDCWKSSEAASLFTNSLKQLSRRAGARGKKAIVKIIYDYGNPKQALDNHQPVKEGGHQAQQQMPEMNGQQVDNVANGSKLGPEAQESGSAGDVRELATVTAGGAKEVLPEHTDSDSHYNVDIASEITCSSSFLTPRNGESRMDAVTRHLNRQYSLIRRAMRQNADSERR
ncbi:hypothetical protein MMC25_003562 [Agyrium rufum]|nr:hypothetical protein [Agyrium rufum]